MNLIAILLLAILPGDWPQFRGPNSDGLILETAVPVKWSDTENVVWKVPVPGLGWSSPSVVGDRIYLTTAVPQGEGLSLRTLCLDAETGKTVWDQEIRAIEKTPSIHTKNSHASPTAIVDQGSVYVHFGTLGTARLDAATGKVIWQTTALEYNPLHGSGGSPILYDGKLFIACDGTSEPYVAALSAETETLSGRRCDPNQRRSVIRLGQPQLPL